MTQKQDTVSGRFLKTKSADEAAFDTVTAESAYWIGMMMADGSILTDKHGAAIGMTLSLNTPDGGHVESFRQFLKTDYKITEMPPRWVRGPAGNPIWSGRTYTLRVLSNRLATALAQFGVIPKKTPVAEMRGLDGSPHVRDFWRGCIDGDGCLAIHTMNYNGRDSCYPFIDLVGSQQLTAQFSTYINAAIPGCEAHPERTYKQDGTPSDVLWKVRKTGDIAAAIIKHLYENSTMSLPRKHRKASMLLELQSRIESARKARTEGFQCNTKCSVDGCDGVAAVDWLCIMHWKRRYRHGRLHRVRNDWSDLTREDLLELFDECDQVWTRVAAVLGMNRCVLTRVKENLGMRQPPTDWSWVTADMLQGLYDKHQRWALVGNELGTSAAMAKHMAKQRGVKVVRREQTCGNAGCQEPVSCSGLCSRHYMADWHKKNGR